MQIGSSTTYYYPQPAALPASQTSAEVSPDITRAAFAPATPAQDVQQDSAASAREEADQPTEDGSTPFAKSEEQLRQEELEVADLSQRDREVRAHEQAHASAGGQHAGAPTYEFTRGPDGQRYAVSGEVSIDVSPVSEDPAATLSKMEVVLRAALAPAEPSAQDRRVAGLAQAQAATARVELAQLRREEAEQATQADESEQQDATESEDGGEADATQASAPVPDLDLYRRLSGVQEAPSLIDQVA